MLVSNKSALERLNSEKNLINQLKNKKNNSMSLFVGKREVQKVQENKTAVRVSETNEKSELRNFNPFQKILPSEIKLPEEEPSINSLIENNDQQIKLATAHDSALKVLTDSVALLATKLDDIRPDRLPSVITATSKVVESIRKERSEATKNNKGKEVHYHFYTPIQRKVVDYEVIEA